jgi:hypothetical protein
MSQSSTHLMLLSGKQAIQISLAANPDGWNSVGGS